MFSVFDEAETLFFGGETRLRIFSIEQFIGSAWSNYKKYMQPTNAICRMVHGLKVKTPIVFSARQQRTMNRLLYHVIYTLRESLTNEPVADVIEFSDEDRDKSDENRPTIELEEEKEEDQMKLNRILDEVDSVFAEFERIYKCKQVPAYISKLLSCHTRKSVISLNYLDLRNNYEWCASLLKKTSAEAVESNLLDLVNILILFNHSDEIIFLMEEDFVWSAQECESILDDVNQLSKMNIVSLITFQWPSAVPFENLSMLNHNLNISFDSPSWSPSVCSTCVRFSFIDGLTTFKVAGLRLLLSKIAVSCKASSEAEMLTVHDGHRKDARVLVSFPNVVDNRIGRIEAIDKRDKYLVSGFLRQYESLIIPDDVIQLIAQYSYSTR